MLRKRCTDLRLEGNLGRSGSVFRASLREWRLQRGLCSRLLELLRDDSADVQYARNLGQRDDHLGTMRGGLRPQRWQVVQRKHVTHLRRDWKMADDWHAVRLSVQWGRVHGQLRSQCNPVQQQQIADLRSDGQLERGDRVPIYLQYQHRIVRWRVHTHYEAVFGRAIPSVWQQLRLG